MTENTIALLFPGQGSQSVGMGKDLAEKYPVARQTFDEADEALGYKLSPVCFEGPEDQLRLTEITQPAILTVSIAALRVLEIAHAQAELRRRTQPGRILRARRLGNVQLCRSRSHRAQPRQVHAGSRAGGRGRDGRDPRHGRRESRRSLPGRCPRRSLRARQHQFTGTDRHLRQHRRGRARRQTGRRTRRQARQALARQRALPLLADEARARPPGKRSQLRSKCRSRSIPLPATWTPNW